MEKETLTKFAVTTTVPGFVTAAEIISQLRAEYDGVVPDVSNPLAMAKTVAARKKFRDAYVALDKAKPEIKREALEFCKTVESDYKSLRVACVEFFDIFDTAIKAEEDRKDAEKQEKARIAAEAQKVLDDKIIAIGMLPLKCQGMESHEISTYLAAIEARPFGSEFTNDTLTRAEAAKAEAVTAIREVLDAVTRAEVRAAEIKAEQEAETIRLSEEKRVNAIAEKINYLKKLESDSPNMSIAILEAHCDHLAEMAIGDDEYQEFRQEAQAAKISLVQTLTDEMNEKREAARLFKMQQEELADQKRLQDIENEKAQLLKAIQTQIDCLNNIPLDAFNNSLNSIQISALLADLDAYECAGHAAVIVALEYNINRLQSLFEKVSGQEAIDLAAKEKREADEAEAKRIKDEADAAQRELDRVAAANAEVLRKKAEADRKTAEKALKLEKAKCATAVDALKSIQSICNEGLTDAAALDAIRVICEANI